MPGIGQELLKALEAQQQKPLQSTTAAGFKADSATEKLTDLLDRYFRNIINLPSEGEIERHAINRAIPALGMPSPKDLVNLGKPHELNPLLHGDPNTVFFSAQHPIAVEKQEEKNPKNTKSTYEKSINTKPEWQAMQEEAVTTIQNNATEDFAISLKDYNTFIKDCLKPENLQYLIDIVKTAEFISEQNKKLLSAIGVEFNADPIKAKVILHLVEKHNGEEAYSKTYILVNQIMANPNDIISAAALANYLSDNAIRKYDEEDEDYAEEGHRIIPQAIAIFENINPISEMLRILLAKQRKESPFVNDFIGLLSKITFTSIKEYLILPNEELTALKNATSHLKPGKKS